MTIKRAFAALRNRFKILDKKPFHTFPIQVKIFLHVASFITGS
jgi:hypothetical protein